MNSVKISEANVSKAIRDFLDAKKVRYHRLNAGKQIGSYTSKRTGKTNSWAIGMQEKGCADLLALIDGFYAVPALAGIRSVRGTFAVYIEAKAPGKKQRPEQIEFQKRVEEYGCTYLLADSVDVVIQWFKARGL